MDEELLNCGKNGKQGIVFKPYRNLPQSKMHKMISYQYQDESKNLNFSSLHYFQIYILRIGFHIFRQVLDIFPDEIRVLFRRLYILINLTWTAWKIRVAQCEAAWKIRH